jgi:hypothetical protein
MWSCSWPESHLPWAMAIASSPITNSYHLRDLLSQTVCSRMMLLHLKTNNGWIIVWRFYIRHLSLASIADMLIRLRDDLLSSPVLLLYSLALTIYSVIGIYLLLELKNFWDIVRLIAKLNGACAIEQLMLLLLRQHVMLQNTRVIHGLGLLITLERLLKVSSLELMCTDL